MTFLLSYGLVARASLIACGSLFGRCSLVAPGSLAGSVLSNFMKNSLHARTGGVNFYSSTNNGSSIEFVENKYSCLIPPINTVYEGNIHNEGTFHGILLDLLNSISNQDQFKYKLIFSLFMHSNDKERKLEFILGPSIINNPKDPNLFFMAMAQKMFYSEYKFHGYADLYFIDFNPKQKNIETVNKIIKDLGQIIVNTNENFSCHEFIEFKKWTKLEIIRISNPVSEKCNDMD